MSTSNYLRLHCFLLFRSLYWMKCLKHQGTEKTFNDSACVQVKGVPYCHAGELDNAKICFWLTYEMKTIKVNLFLSQLLKVTEITAKKSKWKEFEWNVYICLTGQEVATLRGHTGEVIALQFSNDGNQIITGSFDHSISVWDTRTAK